MIRECCSWLVLGGPSGPRKIGGELRCILNLFLQQLCPAQSWESDFFSGADSATDHEANMTGEYSGFVNVLDGENATSHAAMCQHLALLEIVKWRAAGGIFDRGAVVRGGEGQDARAWPERGYANALPRGSGPRGGDDRSPDPRDGAGVWRPTDPDKRRCHAIEHGPY